ncbi:hypothetical protein [Hornefia butyriciproducens]|uniref:hypothetical protein n=1 Tax=Hornefia butyriciproducens TaxID=2652293 RepID=UPI002A90C938|nr:hypothetical protein [Hornefia butyriciproducens]MDY6211987.1 hypothetical protein [Hornefia butyriciproducens]
MIKGKLKNGFTVKISDEALDDFEIFEDMAVIEEDDSNIGKFIAIYKRLLGVKQYNRLKEYMRGKNGRISTTAMAETLKEIFELNNGELKNSQPSAE